MGLHRVAYLLYAHKEQVTRRGVIVVGPNLAFLSYIRNVLPALGELDVTQTTVADLGASTPIKATETDEAATVKGDARMAEVLRNALWAHIKRPGRRSCQPWRAPAAPARARDRGPRERTPQPRRPLRHRPRAAGTPHRARATHPTRSLRRDVRRPHARRGRRSAPVRKCVDEVWPKVDPKKLVFTLLSDQKQILRSGFGLLSDAEITALAWPKPPRGPGSAPWTRADQVLIDEAADLIERTPSIAHIVVDEAQDLSPMEVRAIGRRCATGAATVLGDIAQGTTPWAATSWPTLLSHLGKPDAAVRELDVGYRVPRQILDFASRLLPSIAPSLLPAQSLRADPDALSVVGVATAELGDRIAEGCAAALAGPGSVAVICADAHSAETAAALRAAGLAFGVLGSEARATRPASASGRGRWRADIPIIDPEGGPAHPGAGHAGQGPGVRPRDPGRARPDRDR